MSGFQHITEKGGAVKENPLRYAAFTLWEKKTSNPSMKGKNATTLSSVYFLPTKKSIKTK